MATVSPARYVPYGFARAHQVLVTGVLGVGILIVTWIVSPDRH